ncbi:MAG: dihydrodipicolinate synthase family protein, partial [Planctomycetes bacterium]|nr:dihydrodipicolinate synthase family protein [Planctomycetota bacterium]
MTPCTLNGHIDATGLRSVIAYMIAAGCNGIFVLGSTGRGPWFSLRDRALVCSVARDSCGRRPLYGGCMATGLDDMVESAAAMKDAGADCVVVTSPGYFDYGQEEIMRILLDFADRSPLPVLVYDIPGFARVKLDASVIQRLSGHGNIAGVKDATADMKGFRSLLGLLAKLPHFLVFQGKEQLLADSLRAGASGFVVSLVHLDPLPFVALRRAVALGREEEANKLQLAITAVLRSVEECINSRHTTSTLFHILNQA